MRQPRAILLYLSAIALCLLIQISHTQEIQQQYTEAQTQQFPQSVTNAMAARSMRYHHYMWHQVRANWNQFSSEIQAEFRNIGWQPPNPALTSGGEIITNNYAGEDFLYMHRNMIQLARNAATQNGDSTAMISSWTTIPAPGDATYPVPPDYGYFNDYKTDSYYEGMKNEESQLTNPNVLKQMTLNALGLRIENYIHTAMHYRWSSYSSVGYRTGGLATNGVPDISKSWDTTAYYWMGDSYASHVCPYFWKLHGWIDDRIEDWLSATGQSSVQWHGTWTGGPTSNLGSVLDLEMGGMNMTSSDPDTVGPVLQQAFEIFANSGVPEVDIANKPVTLINSTAPVAPPTSTTSGQKRMLKGNGN